MSRTRAAAAAGSAVFFAVAPSVVAGVVPYALTRWRAGAWPGWAWPVRGVGAILTVAGTTVLVGAFARFVREGVGTPSPTGPTQRLVVGGPYRYVRNVMYLAVTAAIVGQGLLLARPVLLGYAAAAWTGMALFARHYEQPALQRRFGADYDSYRAAVPAWVPRRTAWRGTRS